MIHEKIIKEIAVLFSFWFWTNNNQTWSLLVKISHPSIMAFEDKLAWIYNFYYQQTKLSIHNLFTNKYTNNKIIMKVLTKHLVKNVQ